MNAIDNHRMGLSAQRCIRSDLNKLIAASFRVSLVTKGGGEGWEVPLSFRKSAGCFMVVFIDDVILRVAT